MAKTNKQKNDRTVLNELPQSVVDNLIKDCKNQGDFEGLMQQISKRLLDGMLGGEMNAHLGYGRHDRLYEKNNSRNGYSSKKISTNNGEIELSIPRDRNSEFEPLIVPKHSRRLDGIDKNIMALYARGMSVRDIRDMLLEMYSVDLSEEFISNVTDSVLDDIRLWQNRPINALYPIIYIDCLVVGVQENKQVINKAVYVVLGINTDGRKEILGLWISHNEGAKFWLAILTELNNRGLQEVFIFCIDGLTGLDQAIKSVYPQTKIQLCIVHQIRNSLRYVPYKDKKAVVADLKTIYQASTAEDGLANLDVFAKKWDYKFPTISKSWYNHWEKLSAMFEFTQPIRKIIYTTNAIESLNMTLRKAIKNKRVFPNDMAVFKSLYLAIHNIEKKWTMPIKDWLPAFIQLLIKFGKV
jgi:transposase-like protein